MDDTWLDINGPSSVVSEVEAEAGLAGSSPSEAFTSTLTREENVCTAQLATGCTRLALKSSGLRTKALRTGRCAEAESAEPETVPEHADASSGLDTSAAKVPRVRRTALPGTRLHAAALRASPLRRSALCGPRRCVGPHSSRVPTYAEARPAPCRPQQRRGPHSSRMPSCAEARPAPSKPRADLSRGEVRTPAACRAVQSRTPHAPSRVPTSAAARPAGGAELGSAELEPRRGVESRALHPTRRHRPTVRHCAPCAPQCRDCSKYRLGFARIDTSPCPPPHPGAEAGTRRCGGAHVVHTRASVVDT